MARKNIQNNIEASPDEKNLAFLLSSIESAKNELEGIGKTNKKVLSNIEDNKKNLVELEAAKEVLDTEVLVMQQKKEERLKDLNFVANNLADVVVQKNKAEKDLADFQADSKIKKEELELQIRSLQGKIEAMKKEVSQELEIFKTKKDELKKEISELTNLLSVLSKREADQKETNDNIASVCDELSRKKDSLEGDFQKIIVEISRQQDFLKDLKIKIPDFNIQINEKKLEVKQLDDAIAAKKAEYKAQETTLFAIREREIALDQRERFIRAQYERTGIKYE